MVERVHKWLESTNSFPRLTNFENIVRNVINVDPARKPLLQYADFFAYAVWKKSESLGTKTRRWDEIKHKYYNLDHFYQQKEVMWKSKRRPLSSPLGV